MSAKDLANSFNTAFCAIGSTLADQLLPPSDQYIAPPIIGELEPLIIRAPDIADIKKSI